MVPLHWSAAHMFDVTGHIILDPGVPHSPPLSVVSLEQWFIDVIGAVVVAVASSWDESLLICFGRECSSALAYRSFSRPSCKVEIRAPPFKIVIISNASVGQITQ